ncbi:hypothetical protein [Sphingobium sp. SA916]|uniref:hypothetical protein n=1 Tax=Sphingobium sp. SA916 TaxID=1851207 RepID=UPI000C9EFF75|nr:hypothetical protein [Sphingobium sp. SA916]PNP99520.1 hypothetical protein A8G00_04920 [Sphingobium sp. SA916]
MSALSSLVIREIPSHLLAGIDKGLYKVGGGVIQSVRTGKVVAHLQEAKPIAQFMSDGLLSLPLQAGQLVQGEMIRAGVNRVEAGVHLLHNLAGANLALDIVGIGVDIVGFKIMADKLNKVQSSLNLMADKIDTLSAKIDGLRQEAIDADFVAIHSLARLHEEGWEFGDRIRSEQQWLRVAHEARAFQDRFAWRAKGLLKGSLSNFSMADAMLDAYNLCSGLRVASLIACNENALATSVANEAAVQIASMTGTIGLFDIAMFHLPTDVDFGTTDYELAMISARQYAGPTLHKVRRREAAAATRAAPISLLEERGIAPREWLEAARNETESPILMLMVDGQDEEPLAA